MLIFSEMSAREKILWSELLVDVIVAAYYLPLMFGLIALGDDALTGAPMAKLIFNTIGLAIICSLFMSAALYLLNLNEVPAREDELEKVFGARSTLGAYRVLFVCIIAIMWQVLMTELALGLGVSYLVLLPLTPVVMANLLLLSLILASTTKSLMQLFYYRRGY